LTPPHFDKRRHFFVEKLIEFLKPFRCQTDNFQGDSYPTIYLISPAVQVLLRQCNLEDPARQIHGIVATSAPYERVFSNGENLITQLRQHLDPQNVD
jgi:hypothetical protein